MEANQKAERILGVPSTKSLYLQMGWIWAISACPLLRYRENQKICTFDEMTAQEIFEQIKARAERATGLQGSFRFIIDGDKFVHIDAHQAPPAVSMEDKPADCTVRVSSDTLSELLSGKANPATAFMFGKIKVEGNMGLAMALTKIL